MHLRSVEPDGVAPAVPTEVVDLVFQGPVVRFDLAGPGGSELVAHVGPEDDLPLLRPGDRVWACWEADSGRLLRRADRVVEDPETREINELRTPITRSEP
jgi:spermidine/putrescine transport system ATP-binding protein